MLSHVILEPSLQTQRVPASLSLFELVFSVPACHLGRILGGTLLFAYLGRDTQSFQLFSFHPTAVVRLKSGRPGWGSPQPSSQSRAFHYQGPQEGCVPEA